MTILSIREQGYIRSGATRSVLEKTDRILGQPSVRVVIRDVGQHNAPAFTDGETITINSGMDPIKGAITQGFTPKSIMLATGLNYHELAHCMFTPRLDSALVREVRNRGHFMALNILEDQLAETRFVKRYETARHYFTALVTNYMMDNEAFVMANYPLVSGRLFLPKRFRDMFRERYAHQDLLGDIDRIVDEYKQQVWPDNEMRMIQLIKEFHELLNQTSQQPTATGTPHDKQTQGKPDTEASRELAQEPEFVDDEEDEGETQGGGDQESEDETDGSAQSDADEEGDGQEDGDDTDEEEEGEAEQKTHGGHERPDNAGARGDDPEPTSPEDLMDEVFEDALDEVSEELDDRIESIKQEERNYQVIAEPAPPVERGSTTDEAAWVAKCVEEFRRVQQQHAPGWHTMQRTGKLDPRNYAKALRGDEYVFKKWQEGVHDALDFEVVFCLDQSGSMSRAMGMASTSLWVLKRTFEECDGIVTVLGFSDEVYLLSQRGERSKPHIVPDYGVIGGTMGEDTLSEARRVLSVSQKPLKLCVVISDGGFHDHNEVSEVVKEMGNNIAFVGINMDVSNWDDYRHVVHTQTIQEPSALVDVVKNLALRLSDERLNNRSRL